VNEAERHGRPDGQETRESLGNEDMDITSSDSGTNGHVNGHAGVKTAGTANGAYAGSSPAAPATAATAQAETKHDGSGMGLTRLAIGRPWTIITAIVALLIFGIIGYTRLGVELYPSVNFPVVLVTVAYPGASPEVVESLVSRPVEDAIAGLQDLDYVQSFSSEGFSSIAVTFTDKADPKTVAIEVEKRVNAARSTLPADVLAPSVQKFDFTAQPIMNLGLSGARGQEQLYDIAKNRIRPKLEGVNGVGQVSVVGGREREIQVKIDPSRLRAYGLTLQQVTSALGAENVTMPGGTIEGASRNFSVRVDAKFRTVQDVEESVVFANPAGGNVRVRDIGQVVDGYKTLTMMSRVDGKDAVSLSIMKESSANVTSVATGVRKQIDEINKTLPEGTQLTVITDNSVFIANSLRGVQTSLLEAVFLTGLVLLIFLHSWRSTVIVLLAIPTSLIATFFTMWLQGFTLNFLTTLALALTVGILVDDSIVVLENIFRHLKMGKNARQAALDGRSEIGMAAIAITMVDVVVFTPVALMSGTVGQFFRQFGFTVVAATLFSLLISFTLTPLIASRWLRAEDEHGSGLLALFGRWFDRQFGKLERFYGRFLRASLRWRWAVIAGAVVAFGAGIALPAVGLVKSEFAPSSDNGIYFVQVELPPGSTVQATSRAAEQIEAKILQQPEVDVLYSAVGRGISSGIGGNTTNIASLTVKLKGKHERSRTSDQVAREAATFGAGMPGVKLEAATDGVGGNGKPIQITVYGDDLKNLDAAANKVVETLTSLGGLQDIANSGKQGSPEYVISIDRQKAADLGLSAVQVASTVRTAYAGTIATQLRQDGATASSGAATGIDVRVQLTDDVRNDLDRLVNVPLLSPARGGQVLLGQVATIGPSTTLGQIQRRDKQRNVTITAALAQGKVVGEVSPLVETALKKMDWPEGTRYKMGGEAEQQQETFVEFAQAIGLSVILTYMLLVALYESPIYPLVVLTALPLALVGAMAGLAISGETLNLFSLIGVIMLTGLVGKNSILVVDYTNTLRKEGMSRLDALMHAGPARLRPILMTSAAMICAQIPLVLKLEEGAEIQAPLAVVVMGGMITSTFLALIFVPSMYTIVDDFQNLLGRIFRWMTRAGKKPTDTPHIDNTPDSPDSPARKEETMHGPNGNEAPNRRLVPAGANRVAGTAIVAGTLIAGSLLLSACGAADTAKAAPAPAPVNVATTEVKRDTVKATYEGSGAVDATDSVTVLPKVAGRIVSLNVEVGQRVEAGQVMAEIEHYTLDTQVAQAAAGIEVARARLAQLERGARSEDVAIAAAQRDAAQAQAQAAAAQATAAAQGISTLDAQIKAASEQANAAQASAAAARSRVGALTNPRGEDVQLLQGQINLAKIRLAQSQSRDEEMKIAQTQVELARVQLDQAEDGNRPEAIKAAQIALDLAQTTLDNLTQMPVRAEDLSIAKMNIESAEAGYKAAQASYGDAVKSRNDARTQAANLPPLMTRAQADLFVTQAEANLHQVEGLIEQRRVQRDQAKATYDKMAGGLTDWDLRQAQLRVEQARAQLDLTKNPDPARIKAAQLTVEQAMAGLDAKRKAIAFDLQSAEEGVKSAQAQLAKLNNPSEYDLQGLEEQANAAEAQANAARAQVEALLSQKAGTEVSIQAAAGQAQAAVASVRGAEAALALRQNPITAEDLRAGRAAVQQAEAAYNAIAATRQEAIITAPVSGVIGSKTASVGSMANPAAPLFTVVSDGVEVSLPVEETKVASFRPGQVATLSSAAFPGQPISATVASITPSADARSRTFTVRLRPDTQGQLKAGMFVQVTVNTEERASVPVVPRDALIQRDGKSSVFVVLPDNKAELRPVRLGLVSGSVAEVLEGLNPGEKVVTAGIEDIRSGQVVSPSAAVVATK
jgi:hydrophobic/amphiphilic exporter-1 (mainly G- bacteria), HAE1 family